MNWINRTCPTTGLKVDRQADRLIQANAVVATVALLVGGIAAVLVLLALLVLGDDPLPPTAAGMGWCVLLALLPQLIGHSTLNWALARLPAATVSVIALGEPVGAIVLAVPLSSDFMARPILGWLNRGMLLFLVLHVAGPALAFVYLLRRRAER